MLLSNFSFLYGNIKCNFSLILIFILTATDGNLMAVRAMVILGIVFGFIGTNLFSSVFLKKGAITIAEAGTGFVNLGGFC